MPPAHNYTGERFGRLTAVRFVERRRVGGQSKRFWLLRCECGRETTLPASAFTTGTTQSCGCLLSERITKHGDYRSPVYFVWHQMLTRCRNPRDPAFKDYGGRGIQVCDRWLEYVAFRDDMGPRPPRGTLERSDVNGHYEPANCRWASPAEQANNRRNNRFIEHAGQRMTLAQWARSAGLGKTCLRYRLAAGWPFAEAIATPSDRGASVARTKGLLHG